MSDPSLLTLIIPGAFALAGVYLGTHLKSKGDKAAQIRELKIRSFTKLVSLKLPMTQIIQTNAEAQLLCQYYDARFHMTRNHADLDEAKSQNNRMLSLIPEVTKVRSDFATSLAELKISFEIKMDLNDQLMEVYQAKSLYVPEVNNKFSKIEDLDAWKNENSKRIVSKIKAEYTIKIEAAISKLYPEFQKL
jgi:hypothetical protein